MSIHEDYLPIAWGGREHRYANITYIYIYTPAFEQVPLFAVFYLHVGFGVAPFCGSDIC